MRAICSFTQSIGELYPFIFLVSHPDGRYPRLRELLNAFCRSEDGDDHSKLVQRIKNVLSFEALLEEFIKAMGTYTPLEFHSISNMEGKDSIRSLHSISSVSKSKDKRWGMVI